MTYVFTSSTYAYSIPCCEIDVHHAQSETKRRTNTYRLCCLAHVTLPNSKAEAWYAGMKSLLQPVLLHNVIQHPAGDQVCDTSSCRFDDYSVRPKPARYPGYQGDQQAKGGPPVRTALAGLGGSPSFPSQNAANQRRTPKPSV